MKRGPIEAMREKLREQFRKPWAPTRLGLPTLFVQQMNGQWHQAVETYPSNADTLCGRKQIPVTVFHACSGLEAKTLAAKCCADCRRLASETTDTPNE